MRRPTASNEHELLPSPPAMPATTATRHHHHRHRYRLTGEETVSATDHRARGQVHACPPRVAPGTCSLAASRSTSRSANHATRHAASHSASRGASCRGSRSPAWRKAFSDWRGSPAAWKASSDSCFHGGLLRASSGFFGMLPRRASSHRPTRTSTSSAGPYRHSRGRSSGRSSGRSRGASRVA